MQDIQHLQSRYLGLGSEINLAAQLRTSYEDAMLHTNEPIPNLESKIAEQTHKIEKLRRDRDNIRLYLTIKNALPDEDEWRHPAPPDPVLMEEFRKQNEMNEAGKAAAKMEMQNIAPPAKKKSTRKKAAVKSRTVKVKK